MNIILATVLALHFAVASAWVGFIVHHLTQSSVVGWTAGVVTFVWLEWITWRIHD